MKHEIMSRTQEHRIFMIKKFQFRSMKEVLSAMDPQADPNTHLEFKEKTHILCSRFLGGAWKTVSLENLKINRIK
jgi:hypothetical protein